MKLKEWLANNKGKTINDYFELYPPHQYPLENNEIIKEQESSEVPVKKKSVLIVFLLTLFFGPFGLFYVSSRLAIKVLLFPIISLLFGLVLPLMCQHAVSHNEMFCSLSIVYWGLYLVMLAVYEPFCIVLSIVNVIKQNKN